MRSAAGQAGQAGLRALGLRLAHLEARLQAPRYDVPGDAGPSYALAAPPACFVLPRQHERYFTELVRRLRQDFAERAEGPFAVFSLR